jgi:inosose dehydratase
MSVANAPCSYGAFEETIGFDPSVPEALQILDDVSNAGYSGIDLGPVGYLGTANQLPGRLTPRGLSLAGGYLALSFGQPDTLARELAQLGSLLDVLDVGSASPPPRPTLAAAGSAPRPLAPPGGAGATEGWSDRRWTSFGDELASAADACRERGYEPTFHHHVGTDIETPGDIDRLLEVCDVGLCLDIGHLFVAGGDPVEAICRWGARINHVHLKDMDAPAMRTLLDARAPADELWRQRVCRPLGTGDLRCAEVLTALDAIGYHGWLVVEQDIFPEPPSVAGQARRDQETSRRFLTEHGL